MESDNIRVKSPDKPKFRHSLTYLKKISILFISASFIYIINSFAFYYYICKILTFKPTLVSDFMQKRIFINNLGLYSQEHLVDETVTGLTQLFKDHSHLFNLSQGVSHYSSLLTDNLDLYRNSLIQEIVSQPVLSKLNNMIKDSHNFLEYGLMPALIHFAQESSNLIFSNYSTSLNPYHLKLQSLQSTSDSILDSILSDSSNSVSSYISYLIAFTVTSCFSISLLYLFLYRPMLDQEADVLKGVTKLLIIIPNNQ